MADDQKLLALASSVAEGSDLAWEQIERQTSGRIMFARSVRDHPISARPTNR